MPIIRTTQTQNFTILNNGIANDESLSGLATAILIYLVTKPHHWNFNARDIKRRFGIGLNKVYRCMKELIAAGYATCKRIQSACEWTIYDTRQTSKPATDTAVTDRVNFERVQNECVLERIEKTEITKKQQPAPTPPIIAVVEDVVVVLSANEEAVPLIFPETLDKDQKKAVKAIAKQLNEPAMTQELLFTLAYAIASGHIKSSLTGYFRSLVNAANNGTFTAVQPHTATKTPTASDRVEETRKRLDEAKNLKVDNASFFEELKNKFGAKASKAIPV